MRILKHPILGDLPNIKRVPIQYMGKRIEALEGDTIAAALLAAGYRTFRRTPKKREPRGLFCAIGCCTDCVVTVNGRPNVRACVTPVEEGMRISGSYVVSNRKEKNVGD